MAKLTKKEKYIADMYVRYFGRAADKDKIDAYAKEAKKTTVILNNINADANAEKGQIDTADFVNNAFQNLFGRDAFAGEMNKYSKIFGNKGKLPINSIVKSAVKADKDVYKNKIAVAAKYAELGGKDDLDLSKISKGNLIELNFLNTVTKADDLKAKVYDLPENSGVPSAFDGKTIILTASADTGSKFVGTEKGDVFKADSFVSATGTYLPTLNSSDELDGGAGKDTLNITHEAAYTMASPTIKSIETITIKGTAAVTADVSGSNITSLETISVLKSAAATVTAAATTDVNVSGATGIITTIGGKNVDIKAAGNAVTSKGAAGTVTVTDAGKAAAATTIVVENGTDVTVNATTDTTGTITVGDTTAPHDAAKAATGNVVVNSTFTAVAATDATANAISVDGGKTITVNQMVTSSDTVLANTTGQTITQGAVVITGQDTTTTVTVKQEKSTAENAAVVAVAEKLSTSTVTFKGMVKDDSVTVNGLTFTAAKALTAAEVAAAFANLEIGDTQVNSGPTANGIFTGVNGTAGTAIWTSGAVTNVDATTSTVTYSANVAGAATGLVVAKANTGVLPVASVPTAGVLAIDAEAGVTGIINGAVKIDDNATKSITDITVDGYGAGATLGGTAAAGSLDKLTTLTLKNSDTGAAALTTASTGALTLNLDNVNGNVSLDGGAATLTGLNITTTGEKSDFALTAIKVETLTIAAAADLDITGSGLNALKTATITGAGDVNLGDLSALADFATLTASAATGAISASVDGDLVTVTTGSGDDSITVKAAIEVKKAIDLGAGNDRLDLSTITTVNATTTAAIAGGAGTDTVVLDANLADLTAGLSSLANSAIFKSKVTGFEKLEIAGAITSARDVNVGNLGYNHVILGANTTALTLTDMANNGTVVLTAAQAAGATVAVKDAAAGLTDVLNVVVNTEDALTTGTLTVASVETINISTVDLDADELSDGAVTLDLNAAAAKTVNVSGSADLVLDMTGNTAATLIDASNMTGNLTVTAYNSGMTVKGGAGDDTLSVSGSPVAAILTGGNGTDTFDVSAFNSLGNAGSAVTITDLTAGETIKFAVAGLGAEKFVSAKVTLIAESTFTEYVAKAAEIANLASAGTEDNIAWFQFNNNTFVVQDVDSNGTFSTTDIIVKINGVKDLSTASFNATDGTLEIA